MSWPLSQDYNEAIQSPASNFADPDLRRGEAVANALGLPMPFSGNFADVYQVQCPDGKSWAVKCFTREALGLRERYQEISGHLKQAKLPFTVDFSYLEKGMRVAGKWYPALKMQWVEGLTLNQFVKQYLDKPATLEALLQLWGKMATYLRAAEVGHCDLQHGNVLLVPGADAHSLKLKLIDYDGMWVPALAGKKSGEVGHPSYQHPQRLREGTYSLEVDRFPLLLVATAMRALKAKGQELWDKYDNGDNLLFKETDLREPGQSALFRELMHVGDPATVEATVPLLKSLWAKLELVPLLADVLSDAKPTATPTPTRMARPVAPAPATRAVPAGPGTVFAFDESASPASGASSTRLSRPPTKLWESLACAPAWAWVVGALAGSAAAVVVLGVVLRFLMTQTSGPDKTPAAPPVAQNQPAARGVSGAQYVQTPQVSPDIAKAPDARDPVRPPVQPEVVPEPNSPFNGTWQFDHDGLNEFWTIKAGMGGWSVSGTVLKMGQEVGAFEGSEIRYSNGTLSYMQTWTKQPPGWQRTDRIAARTNDQKLTFIWTVLSGSGMGEMRRVQPEPTVAVPQSPPLDATITNSIGMRLALIPPGKFLMGSPPEEQGRNADEGPQHEVEITKEFYMGICPVTKGEFTAFVQAEHYKTEAESDGKGGYGYNTSTRKFEGRDPKYNWKSTGFEQTDAHPVVNLTWNDATAFCAWLSKKEGKTYELPAEAEWEYACRAGTTTRFWCGDKEDALKGNANIADASLKEKDPSQRNVVAWDDGYPFTSPVGSLKANPWGLYDMHGNVSQWCADRYSPYHEGYTIDPKYSGGGERRFLRGGSWSYDPRQCRSAHRNVVDPGLDTGFRVALRPGNPPSIAGTAPTDTSGPIPASRSLSQTPFPSQPISRTPPLQRKDPVSK